MMAYETLHTLFPSMHPCFHQTICQLDLFCDSSMELSLGHMPSSSTWLNVHASLMTGALLLTSSTTESMMKNSTLLMQKSKGSSWMPPLLSKIVPCMSNSLKHCNVLKVSLTSKGWVPSSPMPSGVHALWMTKMMKIVLESIAKDVDSKGEVMKLAVRISHADD
jgi:hypothetical protein